MKDLYIKDSDWNSFLEKMLCAKKVIGPKAKKEKFVFGEISSPEEIRLDFDTTILPPKKAFFPPKQELVRFTEKGAESCINPVDQILFGVHFYDVKAIDQLDQIFTDNHKDNNYLANRKQTTIVASNVQNVSKRAFFASVGSDVEPKGHDAFLTKISGGYHLQTITPKGENLATYGSFVEATAEQSKEAKEVNDRALKDCPEKLPTNNSQKIAEKVRAAFGNETLWKELSEQCFSCGTCNTVCPTCYCFDVQDTWNLDQVTGKRYRTWDGCQLHDFAQVSLGAGATENFREHSFSRYRHRLMRKASYLNETLGGPACVGCGRCSTGCVPDIADPVNIINRIMEA